jgi:hypothetical protein
MSRIQQTLQWLEEDIIQLFQARENWCNTNDRKEWLKADEEARILDRIQRYTKRMPSMDAENKQKTSDLLRSASALWQLWEEQLVALLTLQSQHLQEIGSSSLSTTMSNLLANTSKDLRRSPFGWGPDRTLGPDRERDPSERINSARKRAPGRDGLQRRSSAEQLLAPSTPTRGHRLTSLPSSEPTGENSNSPRAALFPPVPGTQKAKPAHSKRVSTELDEESGVSSGLPLVSTKNMRERQAVLALCLHIASGVSPTPPSATDRDSNYGGRGSMTTSALVLEREHEERGALAEPRENSQVKEKHRESREEKAVRQRRLEAALSRAVELERGQVHLHV